MTHPIFTFLILLMLGCDGASGSSETGELPDSAADTAASAVPAIRIVSPMDEVEVAGCADVVVEVDHFELVDFENASANAPGQGHYHLIVGANYVPCTELTCQVSLDADGPQLITAQLQANDHTAYLDDAGETIEDTVVIDGVPGACPE